LDVTFAWARRAFNSQNRWQGNTDGKITEGRWRVDSSGYCCLTYSLAYQDTANCYSYKLKIKTDRDAVQKVAKGKWRNPAADKKDTVENGRLTLRLTLVERLPRPTPAEAKLAALAPGKARKQRRKEAGVAAEATHTHEPAKRAKHAAGKVGTQLGKRKAAHGAATATAHRTMSQPDGDMAAALAAVTAAKAADEASVDMAAAFAAVTVGLGRIVALYHRAPTS
jgi:hypothetical protein